MDKTDSHTTQLHHAEVLEPFYDVNLSYEDNYAYGPFGLFSRVQTDQPWETVDDRSRVGQETTDHSDGHGSAPKPGDAGRNMSRFLGFDINLPFGIPAGPLLNAAYVSSAFRMGFDLAVYKTVRLRPWPCNPFPNVLAVHPESSDGSLWPGSPELERGLVADKDFRQPVSISNSFGVPSRDPEIWQEDMKRAMGSAGPGQLLIPSFQGSRLPEMSQRDYIEDHVHTARLICQTGAGLMEMNTSCPNEGRGRLLCHNADLVALISEAVKNEIGDRPLIIKLAYLPSDENLEYLVGKTAGVGLVQAFSTINTISARLIDAQGKPALPGEGREHSGVCGDSIRGVGLDMVGRLFKIRERLGLDFRIIGVGGVMGAEDYRAYRQVGADAVMSATGALWNPRLAQEIHEDQD